MAPAADTLKVQSKKFHESQFMVSAMVAKDRDFQKVLADIQTETESEYRPELVQSFFKAIVVPALSGTLLSASLVSFFLWEWWIGTTFFIVALIVFLWAIFCLTQFEEIARIHDRTFFLKAVNAAETLDELEEAGLEDLRHFKLTVRN